MSFCTDIVETNTSLNPQSNILDNIVLKLFVILISLIFCFMFSQSGIGCAVYDLSKCSDTSIKTSNHLTCQANNSSKQMFLRLEGIE